MALALRRESRVRKHNFARDRLACVAKFGIDAPAVLLPDDRTRRPLALLGFSGCKCHRGGGEIPFGRAFCIVREGDFYEVEVRMDAPVGRIVQMFTMRFRDLFGSDGVSCVKLPAAVAFPTDDRLLQRIGELRRALPANNVKPLWKSPSQAQPPSPLPERDVQQQLMIKMPPGGLDAFKARVEPRPQSVQISVALETESRTQDLDPPTSIVPMARSLARVRDGRSASAA